MLALLVILLVGQATASPMPASDTLKQDTHDISREAASPRTSNRLTEARSSGVKPITLKSRLQRSIYAHYTDYYANQYYDNIDYIPVYDYDTSSSSDVSSDDVPSRGKCTLNVRKGGRELAEGEHVLVRRGKINQVSCDAFCTGSGATPALQFYKDGDEVSQIAGRVYYIRRSSDRSSVLTIQNMLPRDSGFYTCQGWISGQGRVQKSFNLVFACPAGHEMCDVNKCVPLDVFCDGKTDCLDQTDEQYCTHCSEAEFDCDGRCHSRAYLCDGYPDCADGTDEHDCQYHDYIDPVCDFECGDGQCVTSLQVCDGVIQCDGTGNDEFNCPVCEFYCEDGKCYTKAEVCDGKCDCDSGRDEQDCYQGTTCSPQQFRCDGGCIQLSYRCDHYPDCADGEDEAGCPIDEETCEAHCFDGTCLLESHKCDGIWQCSTGEDELGCGQTDCGSGLYRCVSDGVCIDADLMCDGYPDCLDLSDEVDCPPCHDSQDCSTPTPSTTSTSTTTQAPTTQAPTTQAPTTQAPTTQAPTTQAPTTQAPTTKAPTTKASTTQAPTTKATTTQAPTTKATTTQAPTTKATTTQAPTTKATTTKTPTTKATTTQAPTTKATTTKTPTTKTPTTNTPVCQSGEFQCNNGECIPSSYRCDADADCDDEEDEQGCEDRSCPEGQFTCGGSSDCYSPATRCDGVRNCPNGADEINCVQIQ